MCSFIRVAASRSVCLRSSCTLRQYRHLCITNVSRSNSVNLSFQSYESAPAEGEQKRKSPVLILHGLLGSKNNWHSIGKELNELTGRKIISIDARNHGDSGHSDEMTYVAMAGDVLQLMRDEGVSSASLLGHSMGGRVMMNLALNHSDMIESLMVVDMSPNSHPTAASADIPNIVAALSSIKLSQLPSNQMTARQMADKQLEALIPSKMMRQFLLTNLVESDDESGVRWRFNLSTISANLAEFAVGVTHREGATYPGPCLFLGGEKSDYIRAEDSESIKKLFTRANLEWVPGAGHWVHSEKPAEFLQRAVPFFSQ